MTTKKTAKRNVKEIKVWLIRKGLRPKDVVAATKQERSYTTKTINGQRNNPVVLQWLKDNGCPEKHLGLPAKMLKESV